MNHYILHATWMHACVCCIERKCSLNNIPHSPKLSAASIASFIIYIVYIKASFLFPISCVCVLVCVDVDACYILPDASTTYAPKFTLKISLYLEKWYDTKCIKPPKFCFAIVYMCCVFVQWWHRGRGRQTFVQKLESACECHKSA